MYFCTAFAFLVFKIIQILYRGERIAAHLTVLAMTKRLVILSAKRERIRNTLKRETDCRGAKVPRNDKEQGRRIATAVYTASQ